MNAPHDNPYAPPKAVVSDAPEPPRVRPRAVVVAVALLWTELTLGVVSWILAWLQPEVATSFSYRIVLLMYIAFWFGVSVLVNTKIWQGRNWARIVGLVLVLYATFGLTGITAEFARAPWQAVLGVVGLALDVAAIVLVFGPGREWFRRRS